jgi:formate dehydrogenase major subunit
MKEKNNSQGLHDMGICRNHGVGGVLLKEEDSRLKIMKAWKMNAFPEISAKSIYEGLESGALKNLFVFGEDPVGCATDKAQVEGWLSNAGFVVVQDYFMTETAAMADIILPASFPVESGGSYTNTQKMIQGFEAQFKPAVEKTSLEQIAGMLRAEGIEQSADHHEVLSEIMSLLPESHELAYSFGSTAGDNPARIFGHGCDYLVKRFDDEFEKAFENAKN